MFSAVTFQKDALWCIVECILKNHFFAKADFSEIISSGNFREIVNAFLYNCE